MSKLEPMQVGVMFWTGGNLSMEVAPDQLAGVVRKFGVRCGQLGLHADADLGAHAQAAWRQALLANDFTLVTVFLGFIGENYADIPTAARTVGYAPRATRREREKRTYEASDFAKALGITSVAAHIGVIPEKHSDKDWAEIRSLVRRVCNYCKANNQTFCLETGQESAATLDKFLADVERSNLRINFDPANMVLYGSGDPIEALEELRKWIITVHCKDGTWPQQKEKFGKETPLGAGDVDIPRFVSKLREIRYGGPLVIEREISGEAYQEDVLRAVKLLEDLRKV